MVLLPAAPVTELDRVLGALADPVRRQIVDVLRAGPCRPSELADTLSLPRPAVSRHLRSLRAAGLLDESLAPEDARGHLLRLRLEPLRTVRDWVTETEAFWGEQLAAFVAHAERAP